MEAEKAIREWRGAMIPVLTIFDHDLKLDLAGLRRNLQHLMAAGAKRGNTVFLAVGAGGDFPMLTTDERRQVAETIVEEAKGEVPVIVGCQHTSTAEAVELAKHADGIGADGVQVGPPFYYEPSDDDVYEFFKTISDSISIGIMVYHTWWLGYTMTRPLLDRLVEIENVVSFKWSCPRARDYQNGFRYYADKVAMVDNQGVIVYSHMLGAVGFITHLASVWPEHEWRYWGLLEQRKYVEALELEKSVRWQWVDFRGKMARETGGEANVVKAACDLVGLAGGPVRPPTRPMGDEQRAELRELLTRIGAPVK